MKVILIDDHPLFTELLKTTVEKIESVKTVEVFNSGDDFVYCRPLVPPDLVILDIRMPGMDGIKVIDFCRKEYGAGTKIIVLSFISNIQIVKQAIKAGANGFVTKSSQVEELIAGVQEVIRGNQYVCNSIRSQMINSIFLNDEIQISLTNREKQVLEYICKGYTFKEISFDLKIKYHTVHYYYKNLMKKLNMNKSRDLIVFAMMNGLYVPDVNS